MLSFVAAANQFMTTGADALTDNLAAISICGWVSAPTATTMTLLGKGNGTVGLKGWEIGWSTTNTLRWILDCTNIAAWDSPAQAARCFFAMTQIKNGTPPVAPLLYINGAPVAVVTLIAPVGAAGSDTGGAIRFAVSRRAGTTLLTGNMEDMRIYNRILSPQEVSTIYAARGVDGIVSGLLHRYPLDDRAPGATAAGAVDVTNNSVPVATNLPTFAAGVLRFRRKLTRV